jgi:hypothetical protein
MKTPAGYGRDFADALEELDREFPGAARDESLALFAAERAAARARKAAARRYFLARGIFFIAGAGFLLAALIFIIRL